MNSDKFKKLTQTQLKTYCDNVFFDVANNDVPFPYITWTFELKPNAIDLGTLSIEVFGTDNKTVDDICDSIEAMNLLTIYDDVVPTYYLESRLNITNQERTIKRRQINFTFSVG